MLHTSGVGASGALEVARLRHKNRRVIERQREDRASENSAESAFNQLSLSSAPGAPARPAQESYGCVTFGCFNNLAKANFPSPLSLQCVKRRALCTGVLA